MKRIPFAVIGSGYRALFFAQIARTFPDLFELQNIFCRSEEKAEKIRREYGFPACTDENDILKGKPEFVVTAVSFSDEYEAAKKWLSLGVPVLSETPPAASEADLKALWAMSEVRAGRLMVSEQYRRYPVIASGIRKLNEGTIGERNYVYLSVCHDYHAASLIRAVLGFRFSSFTASGLCFTQPVRETDSRYGRIRDGSVNDKEHEIVMLNFDNGKKALYDFSGIQYRSFIRSRHITVQGTQGEWSDTFLHAVGKEKTALPVTEILEPYIPGDHMCLEFRGLRNLLRTVKSELVLDEEQDVFAAGTMLFDFGRYLRGETAQMPYDIREGLEDAYLSVLMKEAVRNPGETIHSSHMPWQTE